MILAVVVAAAVLGAGALARAAVGDDPARRGRRPAPGRRRRTRAPAVRAADVPTAGRRPSRRPGWRRPWPTPPSPCPPAVAWTAWLGALAVGPALAAVAGGPGLAGVAAVALGVAPVLVVRSRRGGAGARLEQALPGALEAVARSLRSGASLRQAVEEAGRARAAGPQLAAELSRAAAEAGQGAALVTALEGIAARRPLPGVRLGVAALCLGAETGGAQARAVDGVAATVRERLAVAAELRALSSQARISALVIGLAPVGFGAFAAATDPRTSQFLLHTPAGLALLTAGLTLDGLGWLWMQRLSRVEV